MVTGLELYDLTQLCWMDVSVLRGKVLEAFRKTSVSSELLNSIMSGPSAYKFNDAEDYNDAGALRKLPGYWAVIVRQNVTYSALFDTFWLLDREYRCHTA